MTDQELMGLAAKAMQNLGDTNFMNYDVCDHAVCLELGHRRGAVTSYWKPLTDDGDAFRLVVALKLIVQVCQNGTQVIHDSFEIEEYVIEEHGNNAYAATRRAIVRAAAQIGRKKT